MGRSDRTPAKIFGFGFLIQIVLLVLLIWGIVYLARLFKDGGGWEGVGREVREIKEEFNKGYNPTDTLVIDTLEVSPVPLDSPN